MSTHFFGLNQRSYNYSHSLGRLEMSGTGFRSPVDFAIDAEGVAYVLNRSYEKRPDGVHVTMMSLEEEYISEFSSYGEAQGQLVWPTSIALDSQGNVYVADEWLNRITVFDKVRRTPGQLGQVWSRRRRIGPPSRHRH